MERTTAVVIGAGHAGLAMSRCLGAASIDHLVLERAEVANAWRTERWASLRLLTPNWMTRLPGWSYRGDDPDGFMRAGEVVAALEEYRSTIAAPVRTHTTVSSVTTVDGGFRVRTDHGTIACRAVVVASGAYGTPRVPAVAAQLPASVHQLTPTRYHDPSDVASGRVLVVGASASGVQLAEELALAGREVTIAVGSHTRVPRTYRGDDIHRWMDRLGVLDERADEVEDLAKARRMTSLQLVGSPERRSLDLNHLRSIGVELVGKLAAVRDGTALFSGGFANVCAEADLKMGRLLDRIDDLAGGSPADRPAPTAVGSPRTTARLGDFATVIWATGFRPDVPWLEADLLDGSGAIVHEAGVMRRPGLYVLGRTFQRTRRSGFIGGAEHDAPYVAGHLRAGLRGSRVPRQAARSSMIGVSSATS